MTHGDLVFPFGFVLLLLNEILFFLFGVRILT